MIQTSNYATCMHHPNAVSIAGSAPPGFHGRFYKVLAPKYDFFIKYKNDGDEEHYIKCYKEQVLARLNPLKVLHDLDDGVDGSILLCYEKPGDFCHRRLVAKWLQEELHILVPEYVPEKGNRSGRRQHHM